MARVMSLLVSNGSHGSGHVSSGEQWFGSHGPDHVSSGEQWSNLFP